jgi:splicing factor 3B subunit 4
MPSLKVFRFGKKLVRNLEGSFSFQFGKMSAAIEQRNQDATVYIGNLDEKVHDELLWELMLQAGPVVNVHMPKDKVNGKHQGYGFVEFRSEEDADYAMKIMNMIKLYGKPIKVNKASQDKKLNDVGANIFIGNLDPDVDEKLLYDTFTAFGGIAQTPKIMRDPETGGSKGYGFVSFDSFEASDLAIECMNGQYLSNRAIIVQYAFKKESQGERHGSQAERMIAASMPQRFKPNTLFAGGEGENSVNVSGGMTNPLLMAPPQAMPMPGMPPSYQMSMPPPPPMMMMGGPPPLPPNMGMGMGGMGMAMPMPPMPGGFSMGMGMPPPPPPYGMMPPQLNQFMPPHMQQYPSM